MAGGAPTPVPIISLRGVASDLLADKRLAALTGAAPDPVPTLDSDGYGTLGYEWTRLYMIPDDNGGAASNFSVEVYLYSPIAEEWISITTFDGLDVNLLYRFQTIGEGRIYVRRTATADILNILNVYGGAN